MDIVVRGRGGAKLVADTAADPNPSIIDDDLVINIKSIGAGSDGCCYLYIRNRP